MSTSQPFIQGVFLQTDGDMMVFERACLFVDISSDVHAHILCCWLVVYTVLSGCHVYRHVGAFTVFVCEAAFIDGKNVHIQVKPTYSQELWPLACFISHP